MMPPLPWGTGPTPFGLQGLPHRLLAASSLAIRWGGLIMMICLPPLTDMARVSLSVYPSQNQPWPWFNADHLLRSIRWRIGWPRPWLELRVRCPS